MWKIRWLAKLWANLNSYFWIPCPICGEFFAGFECGQKDLHISSAEGQCVCAKKECQDKLDQINSVNGFY